MTNNAENLTDTYQYILVKLSFGIVTGQLEHTILVYILSNKDNYKIIEAWKSHNLPVGIRYLCEDFTKYILKMSSIVKMY